MFNVSQVLSYVMQTLFVCGLQVSNSVESILIS